MKDIADYFSSPSKARKSAEQAGNVKSAQSTDQNVNTENKIENPEKVKINTDEQPKRVKKKRRREPTDPEVKNVTELLSNNLSLISPNTSGAKQTSSPSPLKNPKKVKRSSLDVSVKNASKKNSSSKDQNCSKYEGDARNSTEPTNSVISSDSKPNKVPRIKNSHNFIVADKDVKDNKGIKPNTSNIEINDMDSNSGTPKDTPKVNAFQFMMNSRNNIIGQNSSGKIASEQEISFYEEKTKLTARKDLFKNWADQKGALKRKREEQEVEKCIKNKMKKRVKRLKKLIQGKTDESTSKIKKNDSPVKVKKTAKILSCSDSENSTDLPIYELNIENKISSPQLVNISEVIEENAQDTIVTLCSPPPKKHRENGQNNILNFFGVLHKEAKEERIEVFDDSSKEDSKSLIKIKMFTPESTKKRTSLLSLNRERTKSVTDESSQESVKPKKNKKQNKKYFDKEEKSQLNDSLEDFCSPDGEKLSTSVKKDKKAKSKKKNHDEDSKKHCKLKEGSLSKDVTKQSKRVSNKLVDEENKGRKKVDNSENIDESTQNLDLIMSKKKKSTQKCIIDDDLDDSQTSETQNGPAAKKSLESPIIQSKVRTKSKFDVDDDLVLAVDVSMSESDVNKPRLNRKTKHDVTEDESKASHQKSAETTSRITKKQKKKNNVGNCLEETLKLKKEDQIKLEHLEHQGRVLRPKKQNLNYSDLFKDESPKGPKTNKKEKSSLKASKNISDKNGPIEVELSSDNESEETVKKKSVKVAPVFLKATPKPKLDPEIVEARKKFLMSGVPDFLKKTIEKQRSIEEKEYDIFPSISHIQQKCESRFWNLPHPGIKYAPTDSFNPNTEIFHGLIVKKTSYQVNITTEIEKINHIKSLLDKIKSENPNYPVYKVFRQIYEKSGKNFLKEQLKAKKSPRRRSKKASFKNSESGPLVSDTVLKDFEMWSEKYKPTSSEDILGNHSGVSALKNWLQTWMNYSEEINARGKRKGSDSNSETDFESTDCDSRDSMRLPGNTMILGGPCGSGKTSAVYAIANELGFNVLELNASSKRTGKRLIQELQEATQSHQVRKNASSALTNFINSDETASEGLKAKKTEFKGKKGDLDEKSDQKVKKKMCILLVEDIDLVFDQDEGFLTSLSQLILTSKRPVILTTTDNSPAHVQKLIVQYEYISFMPLSLQCLGIWLQILCLVEGLLVDKEELGNLLEYNKGDIRKTLLELQFWSQSGGQLEKGRVFSLRSQTNSGFGNSYLKAADEELKIDLHEDSLKENYFVHKYCLGSFEVLRGNKEYSVPQHLNLGVLWWNMPNVLNVSGCATERLHREKGQRNKVLSEHKQTSEYDNKENERIKLKSVQCLYDALTLTDCLFKTVNYYDSNEPVVKNWLTDVRDSLELTERSEETGVCLDMVHELTHTLVNGCIENYRGIDETSCRLNLALPDTHERRWRAKQHICEDFLKEPISLSNALDRCSMALDYLPALRDIARHEDKRAASNTKRGNRFRHYLKNLNMNFKESTCKSACNILSVSDM